MLLRSLFLALFIVAIGETIVVAVSGIARAAYRGRQTSALRIGLSNGIAQAQLAAAGAPLPSPTTTCTYAPASGCALSVRTVVTAATPAAIPTPSSCPAISCTVLLQENTAVTESRASYIITAQALVPNGDVVAMRSGTVTFRTFAQAPFSTLTGSLDATLDALMSAGAGDDAGNAAGTLIHVEYRGTAASVPADVWQAREERAPSMTPAWNP